MDLSFGKEMGIRTRGSHMPFHLQACYCHFVAIAATTPSHLYVFL